MKMNNGLPLCLSTILTHFFDDDKDKIQLD